jgi:uncharacterized SAM-binding protein YcdF (DUF218 family)
MLYTALTHYFIDPMSWVLLLLAGALIAHHYKRQKLHIGLISGAVVLLLALAIMPLDEIIARPLENQYPRPPWPAHVDGIVVLDGGLQPRVFASRGVPADNPSIMRMLAGVEAARRYPQAKFVYSGAPGTAPETRDAGARTERALLSAMGVAPGRTLFEDRSLDTGENLANSMRLVHPRPGETWLLVTSAIHMPRAMAIAHKLGWNMVPWPSDYLSTEQTRYGRRLRYPSEGLIGIDQSLHEWIGLVVYRLTNRAQ